MASFLDILGGIFIAGILLLVAFTASDTATTEFFNYNSDAIVQQNLTRLSDILQFDLHKMGFHVPESQKNSILQIATPNHLKFLAHLNSDTDCRMSGVSGMDHIADTIEYLISAKETVSFGDTAITTYRVTRTVSIPPNFNETMQVGVIGNGDVFRYLDQLGRPIAYLPGTKMVEVTLTAFNPRIVLSPDYISNQVQNIDDPIFRKRELRRLLRPSFWRQTRLISKNLKR